MMEMRVALPGEVSRQKVIWKESFGDAQSYIDFFYENRYRPDETMLLLENGEIVSMLTLMPMEIENVKGERVRTLYLYALGTALSVRERGLGTQLLHEAEKYAAQKQIESIILVPASPSLHGYFGKQGYEEIFTLRELCFDRDTIDAQSVKGSIMPVQAERYNTVRNDRLAGALHVRYAKEEIEYQKLLSKRTGADLYLLQIGDTIGCAASEYGLGGLLLIKELLLPDELLREGLGLIAKELSAARYQVRLPETLGKGLGGAVHSYGMIWKSSSESAKRKTFCGTPGYMGFGYD